jgi:hypothetical protein
MQRRRGDPAFRRLRARGNRGGDGIRRVGIVGWARRAGDVRTGVGAVRARAERVGAAGIALTRARAVTVPDDRRAVAPARASGAGPAEALPAGAGRGADLLAGAGGAVAL